MSKKLEVVVVEDDVKIRKGHCFQIKTATRKFKSKKGKGSYNRKNEKKGFDITINRLKNLFRYIYCSVESCARSSIG